MRMAHARFPSYPMRFQPAEVVQEVFDIAEQISLLLFYEVVAALATGV